MRKKALLEEVQRALGGTATLGAAEVAVSATLRAIRAGLLEDGEVKLAGFGSFRLRQVRARRVLLPGSGKELVLPPRRVLRFAPAPSLYREKHKSERRTQKRLSSPL